MDDQASFRDFADKLDSEYEKIFEKGERINVSCHSTGALVVRIWLALRRLRQRELKKKIDCPVERILMFAPANFGSDLAKMGQSFLGKMRSTFFNNNSKPKDFLESGKIVLQGLEPASPFQWGLSNIDLYEEDYFSPISSEKLKCYPFIFAAGNSYKGFAAKVVKQRKKPGTDGTVRICGTSLNTRKCTISFIDKDVSTRWHEEIKFKYIPFAVFNHFNHGSIINTGFEENTKNKTRETFMNKLGPGNLVLEALKVNDDEDYFVLAQKFSDKSKENYENMNEEYKDRFQQFFFKVRDDVDRELSASGYHLHLPQATWANCRTPTVEL